MANTKANIQNIPLIGALNFNTLKTDVKPFNGYNEKNSTVFGGTLGPFYDKKTELYDSDSSYTIFNKNGEPYTLLSQNTNFVVKDKNNNTVAESDCNVCITKKLEGLPDNTFWAAQFNRKGPNGDYKSVCQFAFTNDGKFYYRTCLSNGTNNPLEEIDDMPWPSENIVDYGSYLSNIAAVSAYAWPENDAIVIGACGYDYSGSVPTTFRTLSLRLQFNENNPSVLDRRYYVSDSRSITGSTNNIPCIVISIAGGTTPRFDNVSVHFASNSGKLNSTDIDRLISVSHSNSSASVHTDGSFYFNLYADFTNRNISSGIVNLKSASHSLPVVTADVGQFVVRKTFCSDVDNNAIYYSVSGSAGFGGYTGHDGTGYVPTPVTSTRYATYLNGALLNISPLGPWSIPLTFAGNFNDNLISYTTYNYTDPNNVDNNIYIQNINYKATGNKFYCFINNSKNTYNSSVPLSERLKDMTINGRYIILGGKGLYDIEIDNIVKGSQYLGYIETGVPYSDTYVAGTTKLFTAMYGGGYNAAYQINNNNFIGYLYNSAVIKNCPNTATFPARSITGNPDNYDIQRYFSGGITITVAYYVGSIPRYAGTYMPALSSVIIPYSLDAKMTTGFGNNNFIQIDTTSFFLATFNNNTNLYAAFAETRTENIKGVFSIQSQRYVVDENNVYLANYSYGGNANIFTVGAYKKNLKYIGSLPTMAVFWSEFNKSFYSFSGDSILRKYLEASDINKIYYVGQNPSSQSLWICTDKGIYIISDNDQYKLNFISRQIDFKEDVAIVVSEEDGKFVEHQISLYEVGSNLEEIPIKLKTCFYGLGLNRKALFDCWYIRVFDNKRENSYLKLKVNTITDVSRESEEKVFKLSPSDFDNNNIAYIKYQPKYQEAVAMQLELEANVQIYQIDLGVSVNESVTQIAHNNF